MSVDKIAALNDQLRRNPFRPGRNKVLFAGSLAQEPMQVHFRVLAKVAAFDRFTPDNDPYGERDFGSFEFENNVVNWKVDYFDNDLTYHSPNPADPDQTIRVLTICYSFDY